MLSRFIKWYAVLSSVFTALLVAELTLASIVPGSTASKELYSHLMRTRQDVKQHVKSQSCLITTRFSWCPSLVEPEKTPMTTSEPENATNSTPSGPTPDASSPTK